MQTRDHTQNWVSNLSLSYLLAVSKIRKEFVSLLLCNIPFLRQYIMRVCVRLHLCECVHGCVLHVCMVFNEIKCAGWITTVWVVTVFHSCIEALLFHLPPSHSHPAEKKRQLKCILPVCPYMSMNVCIFTIPVNSKACRN